MQVVAAVLPITKQGLFQVKEESAAVVQVQLSVKLRHQAVRLIPVEVQAAGQAIMVLGALVEVV
jgi:hypothetical protein